MKRMLNILISLMGLAIGVSIGQTLRQFLDETGVLSSLDPWVYSLVTIGLYLVCAALFAFLFFLIFGFILRIAERIVNSTSGESGPRSVPMPDIIFGCVGLLLGLLMAYLITHMLSSLVVDWLFTPLSSVLYLILAALGAFLFYKRWKELPGLSLLTKSQTFQKIDPMEADGETLSRASTPKVLDTSVIIDGRIFDVCATGFIEGPLVIPSVVLSELRHIADASDALKRNRGRRGLDILQRIQKELEIEVLVDEREFDDAPEVDVKILRLAQALNGCVVTNDYNLNKVAGVSGIKVLNINDLANAVKPVAIAGEEMQVVVSKEGKEAGQGVAYLDDGTMIVIDGAKTHIGERMDVVVTSVLQTSAGRMIFARMKTA